MGLAFAPSLGPDVNGLTDLLTSTFDRMVYFDSFTFGNVDPRDDFGLFVDGVLVAPTDRENGSADPCRLNGLPGRSIGFGADAFSDSFNIRALSFTPVLLPDGLPLARCGLGALELSGRRQRA